MTEPETTTVLTLNSGSSSLKFGLYRVGSGASELLVSGEAESIGDGRGRFHARGPRLEAAVSEQSPITGQGDAILRVAKLLTETGQPAPDAVGHRVVHGGPKLRRHCLIDASVLAVLETASAFAPLHMPEALAAIRFAQAHFPRVPQAACFDTAFHAHMPDVARTLPIARDLQTDGVQRYGFHGLSCESIMRQLAETAPERVIIAHLGNGASITAVRGGVSIDTSMGLTPTGGVIMGTRSGDLDPGVLIYLLREKGLDADALEALVDQGSGLLGVSGVSADMRVLHAASGSNPAARLAVEMFCYSVRKQIAAMTAALGGVDLIVFTGGIGENDALARDMICRGLSWIGVSIDDARNRSSAEYPISEPASRCAVLVVPSQEDEQIARHTWMLVSQASP